MDDNVRRRGWKRRGASMGSMRGEHTVGLGSVRARRVEGTREHGAGRARGAGVPVGRARSTSLVYRVLYEQTVTFNRLALYIFLFYSLRRIHTAFRLGIHVIHALNPTRNTSTRWLGSYGYERASGG